MATIKVIPPREKIPDTLRVAAYCRVSSDSADQKHSYAAQIRAYTDEIGAHEGWELVDVYADEGLTGTRMEQRDDFNRMIADCRKGKIDRVLVKSISRFSRNTRDCLATLRELTALGVTVCFEKENIDTGTLTTELMVSVSGALAQEESVSISKNQRLSYQRRMERGEFITCKAPYGYRLKDGKNLEIHEEEAAVIRLIFARYLAGVSTTEIAAELISMGLRTRDGKEQWSTFSVAYILQNEKYIGDALCQKTLATDNFPFIKKRNQGEKDQYYVDATHPAIITKEDFERANALLLWRSSTRGKTQKKYLLTKTIYCGCCGSVFSRKETKNGYVTWACRTHNYQAQNCSMGRIPETEIYAAFVRMYNKLKHNEAIVLKPALAQMDDLNAALQRGNPAMLEVNRAIADASDQCYKLTVLQTRGLLDADACGAKLREVNAKLAELRRERRRLLQNEDLEDVMEALRQTADTVAAGPERMDSFDEILFTDLVEKITAESQTCLRFQLRGGIELTEQLGEVSR
ncbi:MAG: recombinase family protein [Dysosmobacter sp.]|jgi:DNA invertase Pin-like site-specific DNA recombinase|nr:recombinase family protein [Dysosmobacter sp.]